MTVQATPGGSRPHLGWGSVVAGLPSPIGGAPPVHGELGRAAGLIRDTALVGAGFLCLMLSTQVALPQTPGLGVELDEDKLHFYTRQP